MLTDHKKNNIWEETVNLTKIKKGGIDIDVLLSALEIEPNLPLQSDKTYNNF